MASDWVEYEISELCELIVDCVNKTAPKVDYETSYKMLRTTNVRHGMVDTKNCNYVEKHVFEKWTRRSKVLKGDILLTREAPIGEVGRITVDDNLFLGQRLMQYRVNPSLLDSRFLLYSFLSPYLQHQFYMHEGTGSVVSHIRVGDCLTFKIPTPPLPEQKAIAHILGSLDDKIELNRQMNETLEAMAQALFKSWFVDFDPVIDNALAAGNAIPDEFLARAKQRQAMQHSASDNDNQAIRALFPDAFEFTEEMGWIPEGWRTSTLDDLTTELRRGISPKYTEINGVRVVNQRCIRNHSIDYSVCRLNDASLRKVEGRYLEVGDILVNSTGVGTLGRMAQVFYLDEPTVVDSHVTVVRPNKELIKPYTFGRLMLSIEPLVESMGLGSTGQTELSRVHLGELVVCVPPTKLQEFVEKSFLSYSDQSAFNIQQNITLTKLRDTLLPKLMSGELCIADAAAMVEEV